MEIVWKFPSTIVRELDPSRFSRSVIILTVKLNNKWLKLFCWKTPTIYQTLLTLSYLDEIWKRFMMWLMIDKKRQEIIFRGFDVQLILSREEKKKISFVFFFVHCKLFVLFSRSFALFILVWKEATRKAVKCLFPLERINILFHCACFTYIVTSTIFDGQCHAREKLK